MPLMPSLSAGAKRTSGSVRHVASSFSSTEVCFEGVSAAQQNMVLNIFKSRGGMPPCSSISRQRPCSSEKLNQRSHLSGGTHYIMKLILRRVPSEFTKH